MRVVCHIPTTPFQIIYRVSHQVKKEHPTLKQFKEQIDKYEGIHEQVGLFQIIIKILKMRFAR